MKVRVHGIVTAARTGMHENQIPFEFACDAGLLATGSGNLDQCGRMVNLIH